MEKKKKEKETINMKYVYYIVAAVVVIGIIGLISLLVGKNNNKSINIQNKYALEENRMIPVSKNGKYGFIDKNGKEITKIEYDYVLDYNGKYAIVNKDRDNMVIDQNGKVKFKTRGDIRYDSTTDYYVIDGRLYNSNLRAISNKKDKVTSSGNGYFRYTNEDNTKGGVINRKGNVVYTQELENKEQLMVYTIETSDKNENVYCAITRDNKVFAIINCDTGKVVRNYSEDMIYAQGNNIFEIGDESKGTVENVFIKDDKVAISSKVPGKMKFLDEGYVLYKDDKTTENRYYDVKTGKIYKEEPFDVNINIKSDFEKNMNVTKIYGNNKYGLVQDKTVIIPCEYDNIYFLPYDLYTYLANQGKNYIIAKAKSKTYLYDIKSNKRVKEFDTTEKINTLVNSTFIYYNKDNKVYVYNLVTGKENSYDKATIDIYGNYIKLNKGNTTTYYNRNLDKIYNVTEAEKTEEPEAPEVEDEE